MKRILFVFAVLALVVSSCGESKKEEVKKEVVDGKVVVPATEADLEEFLK